MLSFEKTIQERSRTGTPLQAHSLLIFSTPAISFVKATVAQIPYKGSQHSFDRVNTRPFIHLSHFSDKTSTARKPTISAYISARIDKLRNFSFELNSITECLDRNKCNLIIISFHNHLYHFLVNNCAAFCTISYDSPMCTKIVAATKHLPM